jgi:sigma-B regulation protein RsbU (phosphoserine phosphatase)
MNQRLLRKTLSSFYSKKFDSGTDLLTHVVQQIVSHAGIEITGGRVWRLRTASFSYELVAQVGSVQKIRDLYRIRADRYAMFKLLPKQRTVVMSETNQYLRRKGILRYSATGVGDIVRIRNTPLYQYILSFNTNLDEDHIAPTLDIISIVVSNMLTSLRNERRSTQYKKDLDKAREIQQSILPDHARRFHHYEIYGMSVADKIVGGDFFDYIESEDGDRLSIAIGDAASKGMVSAVQALYVSGALRMGIGYQTKLISLVHRINLLVNRMFPAERFITLVVAELTNDTKGICLYINAGHPPPILFHAHTRDTELLEPTGTIIGPFPEQTFRRESAVLDAGDVLLLYTDGLMEAMDAEEHLYGERGLAEDLVALHNRSAEEIAHAIIERVQKYGLRGKNQDDKTIVVVKRLVVGKS